MARCSAEARFAEEEEEEERFVVTDPLLCTRAAQLEREWAAQIEDDQDKLTPLQQKADFFIYMGQKADKKQIVQ